MARYIIVLSIFFTACDGATDPSLQADPSVVYCKDVASCRQDCDTNTILEVCTGLPANLKLDCEIRNSQKIQSCYYQRID